MENLIGNVCLCVSGRYIMSADLPLNSSLLVPVTLSDRDSHFYASPTVLFLQKRFEVVLLLLLPVL